MSVTPTLVSSTRDGSQPPEGEVQELDEVISTMCRWISATKPSSDSAAVTPEGGTPDGDACGHDESPAMRYVSIVCSGETLATKPICDVSGCGWAGRSARAKLARSHIWDGSLEAFRKSDGITVFIFAHGLWVDVEVKSMYVLLIQRINTSNWYLLVMLRYQN